MLALLSVRSDPKKRPPDLSGPVAFLSVGGVYGLRWELASSRRKATGPNRGALRSLSTPAGTAHGVVRHLAVAHQELMTRPRARHMPSFGCTLSTPAPHAVARDPIPRSSRLTRDARR